MTDLGTLSVDRPGGLVVFGWWIAERPGAGRGVARGGSPGGACRRRARQGLAKP